MAALNERARCVRCNETAPDDAMRCPRDGCIAFYRGRPLQWWPLQFDENEEVRFLFAAKVPDAERLS